MPWDIYFHFKSQEALPLRGVCVVAEEVCGSLLAIYVGDYLFIHILVLVGAFGMDVWNYGELQWGHGFRRT
jgi:hypothetical protein